MEGTAEDRPRVAGREQWLRGASALAVLETALNAIDAPAFVVDLGGAVLHANTNAQALLDRDWSGVSRSLVDAVAGASRPPLACGT